jgi:hypothetical protein
MIDAQQSCAVIGYWLSVNRRKDEEVTGNTASKHPTPNAKHRTPKSNPGQKLTD